MSLYDPCTPESRGGDPARRAARQRASKDRSRFILFGKTYDEHRWGVLMQRWRDLRAQLHGVVIAPGEVGDEPAHREIAGTLNWTAPAIAP
jgi:hypothetical protein